MMSMEQLKIRSSFLSHPSSYVNNNNKSSSSSSSGKNSRRRLVLNFSRQSFSAVLLTVLVVFNRWSPCRASLDHSSPALDSSYMSDSWAMLSGRVVQQQSQSSCVSIPRNFTLCHGIDYDKMRLPNLLEHEMLDEAMQQSVPWIPLLRLNCHSDTQLFLCSLFAPVCLERAIYPCRTLCEAVKAGCGKRMEAYGFPWPDMLKCEKFPVTNDMCIQPRENYQINQSCPSCSQVGTFENILDHFCRSDYVLKVKLSKVGTEYVEVKRGRPIKPHDISRTNLPAHLSGLRLKLAENNQSCPCPSIAGSSSQTNSNSNNHNHNHHHHHHHHNNRDGLQKRFLAMANRTARGEYVLNLILPWKKEKQFKRALRMFRKLDCKMLGTQIRERARRERSRGNNSHSRGGNVSGSGGGNHGNRSGGGNHGNRSGSGGNHGNRSGGGSGNHGNRSGSGGNHGNRSGGGKNKDGGNTSGGMNRVRVTGNNGGHQNLRRRQGNANKSKNRRINNNIDNNNNDDNAFWLY